MRVQKFTPFYVIILVGFIIGANIFAHKIEKPPIKVSTEKKIYNLNENIIVVFNLGFSRAISSLLWVHTLLESDEKYYQKGDLGSWMFIRFNTIAALDKKFYDNYLYGGKYLSIIKDDLSGAEELYRLGLIQYPNDFWLSINNAHNYLFEMGNSTLALKYYSSVQFDPLAQKYFPLLPSLVAKLEKVLGRKEAALELLKTAYEKSSSERFKRYYLEKLYALKAEIDLDCLNDKISDKCSMLDYFKRPYIKDNKGVYKAQIKWNKFKFSDKIKKRLSKKRGN